jgi:undecaprenyl diphosphate synthase
LLPDEARQALTNATITTAQNTGLQLVIALSYSSRWEIIQASKSLAEQVKSGVLDPSQIDETHFVQALSTKDFPDPELMIRTSGEHRISNFLLFEQHSTLSPAMPIVRFTKYCFAGLGNTPTATNASLAFAINLFCSVV